MAGQIRLSVVLRDVRTATEGVQLFGDSANSLLRYSSTVFIQLPLLLCSFDIRARSAPFSVPALLWFLGYSNVFLLQSLITLRLFVFELCCGKTDRETKQTSYPRWQSFGMGKNQTQLSHRRILQKNNFHSLTTITNSQTIQTPVIVIKQKSVTSIKHI